MTNTKGRGERVIIDAIYHQLRTANTDVSSEGKVALERMARHLLSEDGEYPALLDFLAYYGAKYVLQDVINAIIHEDLKFNRVIELGAGYGWLSEGIGKCFKVDYVKTDSRGWPGIHRVIDIESVRGLWELSTKLVPTDLVVMSDVIHCLEPEKRVTLMSTLKHNDVVVVEYLPTNTAHMRSFNKQIRAKGCIPVNRDDMMKLAGEKRTVVGYPTSSHEIYIYEKGA